MRYIPEWVPGAGFKRVARGYADAVHRCATLPYMFTKQQMDEQRHKTSFLSQCIESAQNDPQLEFIHKFAALSLFGGGADTVSIAQSAHTPFPKPTLPFLIHY